MYPFSILTNDYVPILYFDITTCTPNISYDKIFYNYSQIYLTISI